MGRPLTNLVADERTRTREGPRSRVEVFRLLVRQVGFLRAARLSLLKAARHLLDPSVRFHYGQTGEDAVLLWLVEEYIGRRPIVYVDVGCHHPTRISNSYAFYLMGSHGLAIDLDPELAVLFARERPRDVFACAALSDVRRTAVVQEFSVPEVSTINASQAARWREKWTPTRTRVVETVALAEVVERELGAKPVDVLMIDVEGEELAILKGAHLTGLRPLLIMAERHGARFGTLEEDELVQLLSNEGYRLINIATMNLYFLRKECLQVE